MNVNNEIEKNAEEVTIKNITFAETLSTLPGTSNGKLKILNDDFNRQLCSPKPTTKYTIGRLDFPPKGTYLSSI